MKTTAKKQISVAMIGGGKMATAIATGLKKNLKDVSVKAYDVSPEAAAKFTKATNFATTADLPAALAGANIVFLAVKPQFAEEALADAKPYLKGKLLISIVAGWTIDRLQRKSGLDRVIRVMPNTPALAGEGMSCFAPGPGATAEDEKLAYTLLTSIGLVRKVSEKQMDAVTGLSGSGPAYVMEFIMGLADGGVYCGLTRDAALELAIQTVLGTAVMCRDSQLSISELRDAVISPAGTTARGILALQEASFKAASAKAVIASAEYSAELGKAK